MGRGLCLGPQYVQHSFKIIRIGAHELHRPPIGRMREAGAASTGLTQPGRGTRQTSSPRGQLPLGWVQRAVPAARLSNLDEVRAWYQAGADGTVEVRLGQEHDHPPRARWRAGRRQPTSEIGW